MKNLILFLSTVFLVSCAEKEVEVPAMMVSKDTMVILLTELHVEQAKVSLQNINSDSSQVLYKMREQNVLEKYNIDQARFDTSYKFYLENVRLMDDIYARVVDSLGLLETKSQERVK